MNTMTKKFMTFKHWQTGEMKTIEFRDADVPANPSSERLVGGMRPNRSLRT